MTRAVRRHALGRQELDGEFVLDLEGALWSWEMLEAARAPAGAELDRIVVAIDPPVTSGRGSDECGIIVGGRGPARAAAGLDGRGDRRRAASRGSRRRRWAERAVELYHAHGADRLVAEVNQGGEHGRDADPRRSIRWCPSAR